MWIRIASLCTTPRYDQASQAYSQSCLSVVQLCSVSTSTKTPDSSTPTHLGDIYLLRLAPAGLRQPSSQHLSTVAPWEFSIISRRRLPDAVGAVTPMGDSRLVASIGPRIVCFTVLQGKWLRKGWVGTLDMATHLSACPTSGMVAAGDRYNSVVLYQYEEKEDKGEFRVSV